MEEVTNKRVKGARTIEFDGITFKSLLECSCYKKLRDSGLEFYYEPEKIPIWDGTKLSKVTVFAPKKLSAGRYGKELLKQKRALLGMSYTPDFLIIKGKYRIYVDVKGKENDVYPIKKKMFLKYLEGKQDGYTYGFIEPHSVKQMLQAIELIHSYE